VRTWAGFTYVAFIVDVYAQRIVAWHAATTKHTDLVMIPLRMALWQRDREGHPTEPGELIHHSDAGSQYTSLRLTEHLALEEIRPSIGSVGDAYDNALMESINGLYKAECIRTTVFHDGPYKTIADVEYATAGWVDWSRYAGDPFPGRPGAGAGLTSSIGVRPWPSHHAWSVPVVLVEAS
jgi:putative transposase